MVQSKESRMKQVCYTCARMRWSGLMEKGVGGGGDVLGIVVLSM